MAGEVQTAPASVDPARSPEALRGRQTQEIRRVASNVLQRKIADVNGELAGKTPQEAAQVLDSDKGKKAVRTLWLFGSDTSSRNFIDGQHAEGEDVSGGNRLIVETDEGRGEVHYLVRTNADSVTCNIDLLDREGNITRPISREKMVEAHILAESSRILEQFPQGSPQRALIEFHVQSLGEETPQPSNGQTVEEVITQAAENTGMLTTDDLRAFVESEFAKLTQNAQAAGEEPAAEEAQALPLAPEQAALKAKLLGLLEGRNLADFETTLEIFGSLEYGPLVESSSLQQYFAAMERGEMDPAKAKLLRDALGGGDGKVFLEAVAEEFKPQAKEAPKDLVGRFIADQLTLVEKDIAEIEATRVEVEGSRAEVKASKPRIAELEAQKAKLAAGEELPQEERDELDRLNKAEANLTRLDKLSEYKRLQEVLAEVAKDDGKGNAYVQWLGLEEIIKVRKGEDIEGLWDARRNVAKRLPELQNELVHHMYASGDFTQDEIDAVRRGDRGAIDDLIGSGKLKDQEMAEYFFRKGITQEEIDKFIENTDLTPEQLSFLGKHKGTLLLVLFLALKEATVMANDMVLKQEGR